MIQTLKKHPAARARDKWLELEHNGCADPATLGAKENQRQYLINRLEKAFIAGWNAAELHLNKVGS